MSKTGSSIVALFLFLGLSLLVLDRALLSGEVLSTADSVVRAGPFPKGMAGEERNTRGLGDQHRAFEPWMRFAADEWAETGRVPFWKDTSFCGAPFLGNGQSALFFPPTMVGIASGAPWWYQGALAFLKLVLGAWFAFLLARHLGISVEASWVAGIVFGYFGFQVAWLGFPLTNVSFLLPAVLLCADRAVLAPSGRRIALLALVTALQHTGGHPETAFHSQALAGLLVLVRAASLRRLPDVRVWRRILVVTGGFVLGAVVAGAQILPLLEYLGESDSLFRRQEIEVLPPLSAAPWANLGFVLGLLVSLLAALRLTTAARGLVPWALLLLAALTGTILSGMQSMLTTNFPSVLAADWLGDALQSRAETNYMRAALVYIGPGLVLAIAGLLFARPRPLVRVLGILFVVFLLVGLRAPVVLHLLAHLPVFSLSGNANLALVSNLAGALLAGFGVDALSDSLPKHRPRLRYLCATLAPLLALVIAFAIGLVHGPVGVGWPASPRTKQAPVTAKLLSAELDRWGRLSVSGWFECPEAVERCQVVSGAGTTTLARLEREELAADGPALRYRFEAALPDTLASPRASLRLWIRAGGEAYKSRILRPSVGWFETLRASVLVPSRGHAAAQLALLGALLVGGALALGARRRLIPALRVAFVLLVASSVAVFARGFNPTLPRELHYPPSPTFDFLRSADPDGRALLVDLNPFHETIVYYGVPAPLGYDGVAPHVTGTLLRSAFDTRTQRSRIHYLPTRSDPDARLAGAMAVRYFVYPAGVHDAQRDPLLHPVDYGAGDGGFEVAENEAFLPRARLVSSAVHSASDEEALRTLARPDFPIARCVVLAAGDPGSGPGSDPAGDLGPAQAAEPEAVDPVPGAAQLVISQADHVAVEVHPERPGYLVLADTFFPGWVATVDGEEREILRANVAFRAVRVEPGERRVDFHYRPASFRIGAWLSGAGLALVLLLAAFGGRRTQGGADPATGRPARRRGRPTWGEWYVLLMLIAPALLAAAR